jgi:hypothetical protein
MLTELHHHKYTCEMEQHGIINLAKARARARAVGAFINHEGAPRPTFTGVCQNVAAVAALLET